MFVEYLFYRMEGLKFIGAELYAHLVDLLDAHAVFAGDGAADLDAQFQDRRAVGFGPFVLVAFVRVEHDQRMQVAVAGMEYVGALQVELFRQFVDALEYVRQLFLRDGAVHAVVIRHDASHGGKCRLAPGPELEPLGFIAGSTDLGSACFRHDFPDTRDLVGDFFRGSVGFAQQDGRRVERIAGMHELLDGCGGFLVHHLQSGGDDARADYVCDSPTGLDDVVERGEDDLGLFGFGQELDRDFSHHAEHAFRTRDQRQKIVARRIQPFAADFEQFAFDGDEADLQNVVHRQAVFQAMHAAGILRDVAADRTGDLAGRIGRVIQAVWRGRFRDRRVAHARLYARHARERIDVQDALHLRHHQQQALCVGQGAAGEAGPGAAEHDRHAAFVADAQDFADLVFRFRQGYEQRHALIGGHAIAFEGLQVLAFVQQRRRRQGRGQLRDELGMGNLGLQHFGRKQCGRAHGPGISGQMIRIARKSLTLVNVGPVTTRSPRPEKKL